MYRLPHQKEVRYHFFERFVEQAPVQQYSRIGDAYWTATANLIWNMLLQGGETARGIPCTVQIKQTRAKINM